MTILPPLAALVFALATITIPSRPELDAAVQAEAEADAVEEPTPEERRNALDTLYAELAAAPNEAAASSTAAQIEALWESSGSATADLLSDRATQAMAAEDREMAARHLDDALRFAPGFAEGWVRRAQLHTLNDEHSEAFDALENALVADPRHFRALLSLARTLQSMDSVEGAYEAYGEVLKVHPYLDEALEERQRLAPQVEGRDL
jgi:tetratricopeptide (TPR) repeat protein